MAWQTEMVTVLRVLINDLSDTPTYTDERLEQLILVAAMNVTSDVSFGQTYVVNITDGTLSPDPSTDPRDDAFMTLVTLKAYCLLARSDLRIAAGQALSISDNGASINMGAVYQGKKITSDTVCSDYDKLRKQYAFSGRNIGRIIVGPYSSDELYTQHIFRPCF